MHKFRKLHCTSFNKFVYHSICLEFSISSFSFGIVDKRDNFYPPNEPNQLNYAKLLGLSTKLRESLHNFRTFLEYFANFR